MRYTVNSICRIILFVYSGILFLASMRMYAQGALGLFGVDRDAIPHIALMRHQLISFYIFAGALIFISALFTRNRFGNILVIILSGFIINKLFFFKSEWRTFLQGSPGEFPIVMSIGVLFLFITKEFLRFKSDSHLSGDK